MYVIDWKDETKIIEKYKLTDTRCLWIIGHAYCDCIYFVDGTKCRHFIRGQIELPTGLIVMLMGCLILKS